MDLLLGSFARRNIEGFDAEDLARYEDILKESDPDLYNWITGKESPPERLQSAMLERLLNHSLKTAR